MKIKKVDLVSDPSMDLGYLKNFPETYTLGKKLGKGGSGTVFIAKRSSDNTDFAVKVIPKVLNDANASDRKKAEQIPSIRREVEVLLALRGTLNVANLEGAYEDARNVYLVMELCRGGELIGQSAPGKRNFAYSERAVASFMRSILQTIAQCHARNIIHRDIKPENFLLLTKEEGSPLKAIDFGLASFVNPDTLPLTAPNVEGTPWYLAPEACRAKWYFSTDVWAAGIIAAYMLTGIYPFIDRITPDMPDLARTLKVICFTELNQTGPEWKDLSSEATDFIAHLLVKDPLQRPSALQALKHPFLQDTPSKIDRPLHHSVVQRIQRFAQNGVFKRRVLEHIAQDLVSMHFSRDNERSAHGGAVFKDRSVRGARAYQEASRHGGSNGSLDPSGSYRFASAGAGSFRQRTASFFNREGSRSMKGPPPGGSIHGGSRYGSFHGGVGGGSRRGGEGSGSSVPAGVYLPVSTPYSRRLAVLLDSLDADADGKVERKDLQTALKKMGYKIDDQEAGELFDAVDVERRGVVAKADLSASLVDWKWVQDTFADRWVESVRRVFEELDKDGDGELDATEIAAAFSGHLCPYEVDAAVHEVLIESVGVDGGANTSEPSSAENTGGSTTAASPLEKMPSKIDFQHLLRLLQSGDGLDDLNFFDDRLSNHSSRYASENLDELFASEKKGLGRFCCF
jgi:calcium-dependent protein kinase